MSHKEAPARSPEQIRFENWWHAYKPGHCGFARDKRGDYLAEFARDAWAAWKASQSVRIER